MLACPSCRCDMRVCVERDIEINICDSCNGVWLDTGELAKLAKDNENRQCSWEIPTNQDCSLTTLHCLRCSDTLLVKVVVERDAIQRHTFQGCPICNGLFIDSETLDSITFIDDDNELTFIDDDKEQSMTGDIADASIGILHILELLLLCH